MNQATLRSFVRAGGQLHHSVPAETLSLHPVTTVLTRCVKMLELRGEYHLRTHDMLLQNGSLDLVEHKPNQISQLWWSGETVQYLDSVVPEGRFGDSGRLRSQTLPVAFRTTKPLLRNIDPRTWT